mgnify:CR=1 FL=1
MFKKQRSLFAGSETRESTASTWRTLALELDSPSEALLPGEPFTLPRVIDRTPVDVALAEAQLGIGPFLNRLDEAIQKRDLVLVPGIQGGNIALSGVFEGHSIGIRAVCPYPGSPFGIGVRVVIDEIEVPSEIGGVFEEKIRKSRKMKLSDTKALADAERLRDLGKLLQQTPPSKAIS